MAIFFLFNLSLFHSIPPPQHSFDETNAIKKQTPAKLSSGILGYKFRIDFSRAESITTA